MEPLYADVIVPLALPGTFTYEVPDNLKEALEPGYRVVVSFGKNKKYSAVVKNIHKRAPTEYKAKVIETLLDEFPVVNSLQIKLWDWMATYYMANLGDVLNAALPSGLKIDSETRLELYRDLSDLDTELDNQEYLICEAIDTQGDISIAEVSVILGKKTIYPLVKSLLDKRAIVFRQSYEEKYKERKKAYISLSTALKEEDFREIFNDLEKRAPKQLKALMAFMVLGRKHDGTFVAVAKADLVKKSDVNAALIDQLVKKEIFISQMLVESRLPKYSGKIKTLFDLNPFQNEAIKEVKQGFLEKKPVLLHGVTSSGKTEVYAHIMQACLSKGQSVLYLVPEIALTSQLVHRLQAYFGDQVGVYHSRFNPHERVEIWNQVLNGGKPMVILGARSAVFLPFNNLGLVVVDEEHESSYKQHAPAPRYHAKDTAIMLAHISGANILLGSATPSLESFFNAEEKKFYYVALDHRYGGMALPTVWVSDLNRAQKKKEMQANFSKMLLDGIKEALAQKEQVILFQNRRGFSPYLQCDVCHHIPHCIRCDVSLTYHKALGQMKCHYCGYVLPNQNVCNACMSPEVKLKGFGTERIEEDLAGIIPEANIARMDFDTTRTKNAYHTIIRNFEEKRIDVLIGTQMITKGLDFDNVGLVGVLNADNLLNFPDFRSHERSYQLLSQVAGRAGRKNKTGRVIVQTYSPEHSIIEKVVSHDFVGMYESEILLRKNFGYPPFFRLIKITLRHRNKEILDDACGVFQIKLKKDLSHRVLGPEYPIVARVKNYYMKNFIIKIEPRSSLVEIKKLIHHQIADFNKNSVFRSVGFVIDVDPQ